MSGDPNKKSSRTFQCRDVLWETFEQMARDLECSIDYLINEAMKQYARQRTYGAGAPFRTSGVQSGVPEARPSYPQQPMSHQPPAMAPAGAAPPPPPMGAGPPPPPGGGYPAPPPVGGPPPPPQGRPPSMPPKPPGPPPPPGGHMSRPGAPPPPPGMGTRPPGAPPPGMHGGPPPPPPGGGYRPPAPPGPAPGAYGAPPPPPPGGGYQQQQQQPMGAPPPPPGPSMGGPKRLVLYYRGQRHEVNKDRFIIGRGKQSSDLTIKDPNVSRQHAMIENLNGQYFMVDMGSTNGIEFNGQRLQRKPVASGDVFNICDHELRFVLE